MALFEGPLVGHWGSDRIAPLYVCIGKFYFAQCQIQVNFVNFYFLNFERNSKYDPTFGNLSHIA